MFRNLQGFLSRVRFVLPWGIARWASVITHGFQGVKERVPKTSASRASWQESRRAGYWPVGETDQEDCTLTQRISVYKYAKDFALLSIMNPLTLDTHHRLILKALTDFGEQLP